MPVYSINFLTREASNPLSRLPGPALALTPFAAAPASALQHLEVRVARPAPTRLVLEYELHGDLGGLRIGAAGAPSHAPTDGLWRHTCMEVFVGHAPPGHYLEFNLAPTLEWAAYRFSGYRSGMEPLTDVRAPRIEVRTQAERLLLGAEIELPAPLTGALRLGLAAVIEDARGQLSYWALRHGAGRPDFHHPDGFALEI